MHGEHILKFWFEGIDDTKLVNKAKEPFNKWFKSDKPFDDEIRHRFETDLEKAKAGHYKDWEETARGRLSLIILYDQFSRNIYRNTPRMYETDPFAIDLSTRAIQEQMDSELFLIERVFIYMPLMHAENLSLQKLSVRCFEKLLLASEKICPQNRFYYEYHLKYAQKYYALIEQFSRFPHRNKVLQRTSSAEELRILIK